MGRNQMTGIEALIMNKAGWTIACKNWKAQNVTIEDGYDPDKEHYDFWIEGEGSLANSPYQGNTEYDVTWLFLQDILTKEWALVK
jgi:hypothetical protein